MNETFNPASLIRPDIIDLEPYTPILPFETLSEQLGRRPEDIIKLDANENPYGPSPGVGRGLAEARYLHIYPDPEGRELRAALAEYTGLPADYLLIGHGADELIDLVMRLFLRPGQAILSCPPTFGMYRFDAALNGARVVPVERGPDFAIPIEAIEALGEEIPKLIFIASPNNPDGSLPGDETIRRLLALPAVVVLDEAYVEFSGGSRIRWVKEYPNLIVLRTFSKWAGLAGLRVGYGAFPPQLIGHLWKIKQPYNVNVAGQLAARLSLEDRDYLLDNVARLIAERERFYHTLAQIDWLEPYPSQANFVLCRVLGRSAAEIKDTLTERGILVRYYDSPGLKEHLRFSIGTPAQMNGLAETLRQL